MIRKLKKKALSGGIVFVINSRIGKYGKILDLDLDTGRKTIELEILLKGEKDSVYVKIGNSEIIGETESCFLILRQISTSREWLDILARSHLEGRLFRIPEKYAKMAKLVI